MAKTISWSEIEQYYMGLGEQYTNYVALIRHIKYSDLSKRLFAYTSMNKLVVSIYDEIDTFVETLHITFDIQNNQWRFAYYAQPFKEPEFVRTYAAHKGIEKFDNFINMIQW